MHFNTVNKYLKDVRTAQRLVRDVEEVSLRSMPEVAKQAAAVDKELENLIDLMLRVNYDK